MLLLSTLLVPISTFAAKGDDDLAKLQKGLRNLDTLLANWEEMTTECNFGEVNRNLLEAKNKLALLEAAKTNALFNKDKTMIIKCKRNPQVVREALGLLPGSPLHQSEAAVARLRARALPDRLDAYIEAEEEWERLRANADAMAYGARVEMGNELFEKGAGQDTKGAVFMETSRESLVKARSVLAAILGALEPPPGAT